MQLLYQRIRPWTLTAMAANHCSSWLSIGLLADDGTGFSQSTARSPSTVGCALLLSAGCFNQDLSKLKCLSLCMNSTLCDSVLHSRGSQHERVTAHPNDGGWAPSCGVKCISSCQACSIKQLCRLKVLVTVYVCGSQADCTAHTLRYKWQQLGPLVQVVGMHVCVGNLASLPSCSHAHCDVSCSEQL